MIYLLYLFYYGKNGSMLLPKQMQKITYYPSLERSKRCRIAIAFGKNPKLFSFIFVFFFVVGQNSNKSVAAALMIFEVRRPEMRGAAKCTCQKPLCPRFGLLLRSFFTTRLQINRLWSPIYSKSRSSCETRETFSIINPFVIAGTPNWTGELEMSISRSSWKKK